jgi:hypothetical protein
MASLSFLSGSTRVVSQLLQTLAVWGSGRSDDEATILKYKPTLTGIKSKTKTVSVKDLQALTLEMSRFATNVQMLLMPKLDKK